MDSRSALPSADIVWDPCCAKDAVLATVNNSNTAKETGWCLYIPDLIIVSTSTEQVREGKSKLSLSQNVSGLKLPVDN